MIKKSFSLGKAAFLGISLLTLLLIMNDSELAIEHVKKGLRLCASTVIPSLFPFMVASELIVASGGAELLGRLLRRPARFLFGIGGEGASALLLGALCGFPMGTRSALALCRAGRISDEELSRLVCFSNNPSSAFVISAVGISIFSSRRFGVILFCITLLSSVTVGIFLNLFRRDRALKRKSEKILSPDRKVMGLYSFASCISSAATSMLSVCAFVIFFFVLTGILSSTLSALGLSDTAKAILISVFELTSGVSAAARVGADSTLASILIASFAVGWSGISVHFQLIGICAGTKINYKRYLLSKLAQGLLNVFFIYITLPLFIDTVNTGTESVGRFNELVTSTNSLSILITSLFLISLVFSYLS